MISLRKLGFLVLIKLFCEQAYTQETVYPSFQFKNDFRFRSENIKQEQAAPFNESDRTRQRVRLRLAGIAQVNEKALVVVRIVTGSTSNAAANTANTDLSDYYAKKSIVLDLAHFEYAPNENLILYGGKTPNYFLQNHSADLIFDTDITPEGMALKYKTTHHEGRQFFLNAGTAWLDERFSASGASDNTDVGLIGLQLGTAFKFDRGQLHISLSHYNFSNIKGATAPIAAGNSLIGGAYEFDYKLSAIEAEAALQWADKPLTFFYQASANSEAQTENRAFLLGFRFGKLKETTAWMWGADYREVQKDAVVGVLSESNSSGGGADIRSTRLIVAYQLAPNANTTFTLLSGNNNLSSAVLSPRYQRIMLDFNFVF